MADKYFRHWKSKRGLNFEESLAEQVRRFPVVYNRTLPAFKDKRHRDNAWEDIAKAVGLNSGREAETSFKRLRDRYTRLKKSIEEAQRKGSYTDCSRKRAQHDLEVLKFMDWIYPHIYHRYSRQSNTRHPASMAQEDDQDETSATMVDADFCSDAVKREQPHDDDDDVVIVDSSCTPTHVYEYVDPTTTGEHDHPPTPPQPDPVYSCCLPTQATLSTSTARDERRLSESENGPSPVRAELTDLNKKAPFKGIVSRGSHENEDELFCSFVASQLRLMSPQQKLVAKYHINNTLFQILMQDSTGHKRLGDLLPTCGQVCLDVGCDESCLGRCGQTQNSGPNKPSQRQ